MVDQNPKRTVLITGANGFIGSRLCALMIREGFSIIAGVRKTADLSLLQGIPVEYRYGDVTQPETLPSMVSNVDYIIHNAGLVKAKSREQFFHVNAAGTKNLVEAVAKHNPAAKKLVYVSSLAVMGPSGIRHPSTEADMPHPITVYGESKLAGEHEVLAFTDKINTVIVRPHAVYGPGDKEMLAIFKTVNNRIKPLFGNTERTIQLIHADDLCRGILYATRTETRSGAVYSMAEKRAYAMHELVAILENVCGKKGFPLLIPGWLFRLIALISETSFRIVGATPMLTREKAGELLAWWEVSTEKAKTELGFESQIAFVDGARQTFQWYREHGWL